MENQDVTSQDASQEIDNGSSLSGEQELINYFNSQESQETDNAESDETTEEVSEPTATTETEVAERKVIVKVDGEELEVPESELISRYQKSSAADRRFEEAANLRKEALTKQQHFETEANKLQNALNYFSNKAQEWDAAGLLSKPDPALLESDPVMYLKQEREFHARLAEIQKAHTAQQYLIQQQEQLRNESLAAHLQAEQARLPEVLPEWKDSKIAEREQSELVTYMRNLGYNDRDLEELSYSRASNIALAIKAMRYDALRAKAATNKVTPQPAKVVSGQATNKPAGERNAVKQFMKTGSTDDLASAFSEMFG